MFTRGYSDPSGQHKPRWNVGQMSAGLIREHAKKCAFAWSPFHHCMVFLGITSLLDLGNSPVTFLPGFMVIFLFEGLEIPKRGFKKPSVAMREPHAACADMWRDGIFPKDLASSIFSPPALPFWRPCRSRTLSTWMPRTRETRASKSRSLDAVPNPILEDRRLCLLGRRGLHRAMREPCGMPPRDVRDVATCGASVIVRFRQTHSCQAWKLPTPREWLCTSCMVALMALMALHYQSRLWLDSDLQTFWHTLYTGQVTLLTFEISRGPAQVHCSSARPKDATVGLWTIWFSAWIAIQRDCDRSRLRSARSHCIAFRAPFL